MKESVCRKSTQIHANGSNERESIATDLRSFAFICGKK
ncbi:MAG: hypothetical protein [Olavius algarvensis Gamma 1 endosymbiont]|nr:MAG: hypothetical protein [Olavius algarvensis Gamma 1 endosymbiont]